MNSTHMHLLLNHFPVIGTLIGSMILLWGLAKKQDSLQQTGALILAIMAAIAIPVFLTGEPAEESVEKLPGVSEAMIEKHEDAATIATWIMVVTGLTALTGVWFSFKKQVRARPIFIAVGLLSILSFAAMARTGYYGGQIRHSEIRDSYTGNTNNESEKGDVEKKSGEKEKDDD